MIKAVNNFKESIEEKKFAKGETDEQVKTWGEEIENQLAEADDKARELNQNKSSTWKLVGGWPKMPTSGTKNWSLRRRNTNNNKPTKSMRGEGSWTSNANS